MRNPKVEPLSKKWLSNREAQEYLGTSAGFLQNLRDTAQVSFYKVGQTIFYKVADLDRLIEKNRII